jgi:hypothetical protein
MYNFWNGGEFDVLHIYIYICIYIYRYTVSCHLQCMEKATWPPGLLTDLHRQKLYIWGVGMITNPDSLRGENIFQFLRGHIWGAQKVRCDLRKVYMVTTCAYTLLSLLPPTVLLHFRRSHRYLFIHMLHFKYKYLYRQVVCVIFLDNIERPHFSDFVR